MNTSLCQIVAMLDAAAGKPGFLDVLFEKNKAAALNGKAVVIFGAGGLGREMHAALKHEGITVTAFCDNDMTKTGSHIEGTPVISFRDMAHLHRDSLIIIAVLRHRMALTKQLTEAGIPEANIACKNSESDFLFMYSMIGSQVLFSNHEVHCHPESYLDYLIRNQEKVEQTYKLLHDEKSKRLLITKLALMASNRNYELFCDFIRNFSEPYRECNFSDYEGTPEDHYYFNNDIIAPENGDIYVDIGAYDGDSIITFVDACQQRGVQYEHVFAFEPDASCYKKLLAVSAAYPYVSCHAQGLWSESTMLRFASSENAIHDQAAVISEQGDIEIEVVSLDDFLQGKKASLIKADPGGDVIPQVLRGAIDTIRKHHPKLALGAYHGIDSIFEIPLLVHDICPEYKIFLRHNTYHLCDTDLIATCACDE